MTLYPNGNPINHLPFTPRSGYCDYMFLPSNMITEPTKEPTKDTHSKHASPLKESATFKNKEAPKAKPKTKKSNNSAAFTAADLQHYLFPGRRESDTDSIPSFDHTTQQAKTEKQVRFFKDNTHDKHFVQIPVEPLRGNENWREWLVAMQLLFVQHGVWEIVISELKPLPASHPLRVWYQRMRDCAVGLIYVNVSETVRKHSCFLASAVENDPDALMNHLWAHYGEPDLEESHI